METVVVTGSQGFIGSYICRDLLEQGYRVIGVDNYSKYGYVKREHDDHNNFCFIESDIARDPDPFGRIDTPVDYVICGAAMIGGIRYFHKYAYDLMAINERIMAATYDWIISLIKKPKKVVILSSSMVYEGCDIFPLREEYVYNHQTQVPNSTYGFQKLACEYFAKGAWEQYQIPYDVVRPFNAVGVGEEDCATGESHVIPDLVYKIMTGNGKIQILGDGTQTRCYTHVKDVARGVRMVMESEAHGREFNIASERETSVNQLIELIDQRTVRYPRVNEVTPGDMLPYDVQRRVPSTTYAWHTLGFKTIHSLEEAISEIIKDVEAKLLCQAYQNSQ